MIQKITIDKQTHPELYETIKKLKHCPKCPSRDRHIAITSTVFSSDQGKLYGDMQACLTCDLCGHVQKFEKIISLPDHLAEGLYEFLEFRSEV